MLRLFLIVILCWAGQSAAWAEVRLPQAGEVSLGRHWELLRDPQDALTVEQLSRPKSLPPSGPRARLPPSVT